MLIKEIGKAEVIDIIKKYYEKNYLGQAIKVKVETKKKKFLAEDNLDLDTDELLTNYKICVENIFTVSGYLEYKGCLHKFEEKLTGGVLKKIIASSFEEDEEIDKIEMKNNIKYSFFEEDKITTSFCGVKIQTSKKKNKVLEKN